MYRHADRPQPRLLANQQAQRGPPAGFDTHPQRREQPPIGGVQPGRDMGGAARRQRGEERLIVSGDADAGEVPGRARLGRAGPGVDAKLAPPQALAPIQCTRRHDGGVAGDTQAHGFDRSAAVGAAHIEQRLP